MRKRDKSNQTSAPTKKSTPMTNLMTLKGDSGERIVVEMMTKTPVNLEEGSPEMMMRTTLDDADDD